MAEKNRKLDPMDPKIFDIPRPSIPDFPAKPNWYVDYGAHNSLRSLFQSRSSAQEDEAKKRNK